MSKQPIESFTIYMHKLGVAEDYEDLISDKHRTSLTEYSVNRSIVGLEGKIFVSNPSTNTPKWKGLLDDIAVGPLDIQNNQSNKSVVILKYRDRFFSLPFGYGIHLLDEDTFERNFGLKICANNVDQNSLKSLSGLHIGNALIKHNQVSVKNTHQTDFQIDRDRNILNSLSGIPTNENIAISLEGRDGLKFRKKTTLKEIRSSIEFFYDNYNRSTYINNGFEWIDKIRPIEDKPLIEELDLELANKIFNDCDNISLYIDWEDSFIEDNNDVKYLLTGTGNKKVDMMNDSIDFCSYVDYLRDLNVNNFLKKIQQNNIEVYAVELNNNDSDKVFSQKIYDSIIEQLDLNDSTYLLYKSQWYKIDEEFIGETNNKIRDIQSSDIDYPKALKFRVDNKDKNEPEGEYNERFSNLDDHYFLMDKNLYQVPNQGHSKIEVCDIYIHENNFIHIKHRSSSSQFSHLFSQAYVSAAMLLNNPNFKDFVNELIQRNERDVDVSFNTEINPEEIKIIIAVIDPKNNDTLEFLPFFSKINLLNIIQNIEQMGFVVFVDIIHTEFSES